MKASCCDDHSRYTRGCEPCQERSRAYRVRRYRALGTGRWSRMVAGEELQRVRQHVQGLLAHTDVNMKLVAAASGVSDKTVETLVNGSSKSMTPANASALSGVTVRACLRRQADPNATVDVTGSVRRLQAMTVDNWSSTDIGELLGVNPSLVRHHRGGGARVRITVAHRDAYRELYDKIQSQADPTGPSPGAGMHARRLGYLPAECWPDELIDDPAASPLPLPPETEDWVAVSRQINGALEFPEAGKAADYDRPVKREIARRAVNRLGWSWERVAWLMGYKSAATAEYLVRGRPDRAPVRKERQK